MRQGLTAGHSLLTTPLHAGSQVSSVRQRLSRSINERHLFSSRPLEGREDGKYSGSAFCLYVWLASASAHTHRTRSRDQDGERRRN